MHILQDEQEFNTARPSATTAGTDTNQGRLDIADNQRFVQPKHTVAAASQHGIPARICGNLSAVIPAIDLYLR